jgi:hypothetical protein
VKVAELLEIVASQVCVFDNTKGLFVIFEDKFSNGLELKAGGSLLGIVRPYEYLSLLNLKLLVERLETVDLGEDITVGCTSSSNFKIGFLDYEEGWVETVTSEELGLSEEPQ